MDEMAHVVLQPFHSGWEVHIGQVHDQVDRSTAALGALPVRELGASYRQSALCGMPFGLVTPIAHGAAENQHGLEREFANHGGPLAEVVAVHGLGPSSSSPNLPRKLLQSFILITWLVAVSR